MFRPNLPEVVVALCFPQCLAHCGCLFEPGKGRGQSEVRSQGDLVELPLPSLPAHMSHRSVNQHAFSMPLLGAGLCWRLDRDVAVSNIYHAHWGDKTGAPELRRGVRDVWVGWFWVEWSEETRLRGLRSLPGCPTSSLGGTMIRRLHS